MTFVVVLWATEVVHSSVAGIIGVVLLVLFGAVSGIGEGVYGFSQPVCYFLIGILTLGLAVHHSGLAERMATFLMRGATGRPSLLYVQMLFSFAALTFALPSASTRGAIMVHVYEQVLEQWDIPQGHPFYKATMMAMGALNRLGSTALLAGGITPVVASGLLGDFSWTQWFVMMSVPFYANLVAGGTMLFLFYRSGFRPEGISNATPALPGPIKPAEIRAGAIVILTALMWFTDFAHGLHPSVPALIALCLILLPRVGILSWGEFERNVGWTNFFVIATSLSLAHALVCLRGGGVVLRNAGRRGISTGTAAFAGAAGTERVLRGGADADAQHRGIPGPGDTGGDGHGGFAGPEPVGVRDGGGGRGRFGGVLRGRRNVGGVRIPEGEYREPGDFPVRHSDDGAGDCHPAAGGGSVLEPGGLSAGALTAYSPIWAARAEFG